jgi:purine-nucleoside phosphorylase
MKTKMEQIYDAADFIKSRTGMSPRAGIILGTGLSGLAASIVNAISIPYAEIPHFPSSTVQSHKGELIVGKLGDVEVVAMAGRFHYYEGYTMQEVTFPVRVMKLLGIERLVISNASGGASEKVQAGDLAVITDHLNLFPDNPLRGPNLDELGPRFPDMVDAYDRDMIKLSKRIAAERGVDLKEAIYAGVPGPNLETRAEFLYFRSIGADVVGMSTIPEVLVARHMNIPVLAFTAVTNEGWHSDRQPATVEEVIKQSEEIAPQLQSIVSHVLHEIFG